MSKQNPNPQDNQIAWIVISILFMAVAFYYTFVLGNIAQGIIWFGASFSFFLIYSNPKK
jgi:hypothetical protein